MNKILELVKDAMDEDAREHSRFDATGFAQFFPEEKPDDVMTAWHEYDAIRAGEKTFPELAAEYANVR